MIAFSEACGSSLYFVFALNFTKIYTLNLVSDDWCFFANMKISGADYARVLQPGFWTRGLLAKALNFGKQELKNANL